MKRIVLNFFSGIGSYLIIAIMGIIIPRMVIVSLGSAANGLITSINQFLTYAALLEAGVGMASQQALYGPVARNDRRRITEIYLATRKYYNRTGVLYFIVVLILSLCYPVVVQSEFTYFETFVIVFFSGVSGVFAYFFGGKYRVLMAVEGKSYVASVIQTATQILIYTVKIFVLNSGWGVIALQFSLVVVNALQATVYYFYFHRNYGWMENGATPDFKAISQSKAVLIHQISSLVFNSTDATILSILTNLKTVSLYTIYSMPFTMVDSLIKATSNSVSFSLGQSYNSKDPGFLKKIDTYETINMQITFSAYTAVYCMLIPFIKLYTGGISDVNYVDTSLALPFTMIYLLSNGRESSGKVITYAGHFKNTQTQTVIEASINIIVSVIGVLYFGIYGVLLGTITALLYRTNDMILYANRKILGRSPLRTYIRWGSNLALFCLIVYIMDISNLEFENYIDFFGYGIAILAVTMFCYSLLACVVSRNEVAYLLHVLKVYANRRIKENE